MLFFSWFTFLCSDREQVPSMFSFYIDCFYDSALQTSTVTVFDLVALKNTKDKTCPKTKYFLSAHSLQCHSEQHFCVWHVCGSAQLKFALSDFSFLI